MPTYRRRLTRGKAIHSVSGVIYLEDFELGQAERCEIRHRDFICDGTTDVYARFAACYDLCIEAVGGFEIIKCDDGSNNEQFRLRIEYVGTEEIAYEEQTPGYVYPIDDQYFYEQAETPGAGVIRWTRYGVLSDDAD